MGVWRGGGKKKAVEGGCFRARDGGRYTVTGSVGSFGFPARNLTERGGPR